MENHEAPSVTYLGQPLVLEKDPSILYNPFVFRPSLVFTIIHFPPCFFGVGISFHHYNLQRCSKSLLIQVTSRLALTMQSGSTTICLPSLLLCAQISRQLMFSFHVLSSAHH